MPGRIGWARGALPGSEPFIVGPGQGLRLSSYVQNIDFGATFEWFEELV